MLKRFCLYGFLKNQRYFEPFIILFFLEKGFSFTQIGILVAFRELAMNITEIPSGALADLWGRRRCMIISFVSYILSFLLLGSCSRYWHFFPAMFFFAIGDAFRTGTHKSIIFSWLRQQGRIDEKKKIYGLTRSWSKLGSALSIIIATVLVLVEKNYQHVFYYSIIPYLFGLVNFMGYPDDSGTGFSTRHQFKTLKDHLVATLKKSWRVAGLRRLLAESMAFEGTFKVTKDFLQPIIQSLALSLPILLTYDEQSRSTLLIGVVYLLLYLAAAVASRRSHKLAAKSASDEKASAVIWKVAWLVYGLIAISLYFQRFEITIVLFILLYLLQNYWRPILISRFDAFADEKQGATVLSIESQAKSVAAMIMAPILGALVDLTRKISPDAGYWPVGILGFILAGMILLRYRPKSEPLL